VCLNQSFLLTVRFKYPAIDEIDLCAEPCALMYTAASFTCHRTSPRQPRTHPHVPRTINYSTQKLHHTPIATDIDWADMPASKLLLMATIFIALLQMHIALVSASADDFVVTTVAHGVMPRANVADKVTCDGGHGVCKFSATFEKARISKKMP